MPATDVHQHLWPEPFVAALSRRDRPPCLRGRTLELSVEGSFEVDLKAHELDSRLALLDEAGIDRAVISLGPTMETEPHPELRDAYNEGILELAGHSGGRLVPLAEGQCRPGFAGTCVSPAALAAGIEPLLVELEAAGQMLFVHPGAPSSLPPHAPAWWAACADYTAQMQAAYMVWLARYAEHHPSLPVVFAILAGGAPVQLERMRSRGVEVRTTLHANVYFDTSSYGRRALELALATYGVTQIVFGSDAPIIAVEPTLDAVRDFGDALTDVVMRENPGRIFG